MLIGFQLTKSIGDKVFIPIDKILYLTRTTAHDLISQKHTGHKGTLVHLVDGSHMYVEEDYEDMIEMWLDDHDTAGQFNLAQ
jgi:hypothetical protein